MLQISHLYADYGGKPALEDINLTLESGGIYGLAGQNGCGKTMLLRAIAGLMPPTTGTTPEMATACAVAFCERIEEAGYDAMVYAGQYVSYIKYDQGALEPYLSWYPEYKSESSELLYPTLYYHMDYWQYSSKCSVAGIGGNVDVNLQFIRR